MAPLVAARSVSRRFVENGVLAVDRADFSVSSGEIHALVGENGAGKSTLVQILAGALAADTGFVEAEGRRLQPGDPSAARDAGIVISYQHPRLDRNLTVLENLFIGDEPTRFGLFLDRERARQRVAAVAPDTAARLLHRTLGSLSSGRIRIVSLIGALLRLPTDRPGVLILDEPTEATTPSEADDIFGIIADAAHAGHGIVFISHRLPEVVRVADRVTVMRAGRVVESFSGELDAGRIAAAMLSDGRVTHHVVEAAPRSVAPASARDATPVMRLEGLGLAVGGRTLLEDVSLDVHSGRIVGVTGIRENGVEALEDILGGMAPPTSGRFEVLGVNATSKTPDGMRRLGLRYVPTDRLLRGASVDSTVSENLIAVRRRDMQRGGILDRGEIGDFAGELRRVFRIEGGLSAPLRQLSGGNIQKVILSRELEGSPAAVVICEPGWGLDFRSRELIMERIRSAAAAGAGVVVISTDIDEVLELADTVIVLYDGKVAGRFQPAAFSGDRAALRRRIGHAMMGAVEPQESAG